jgi:hypothetical protein
MWLRLRGFQSHMCKKHATGRLSWFWNLVSPTKATWNGHGSSTCIDAIMSVNWRNEEMCYGGQDREMGEKFENMGMKGKRIRYYAILLHFDHPRGYAKPELTDKNRAIR